MPVDVDRDAIDEIRAQLHRVALMRHELERLTLAAPDSSTTAGADLTDQSMTHVYDTANFHLSASLDHLLAIQLLLDAGWLPAFATMTMLRTALETALASYWVLEPDDRAERRARGLASAFASLEERRKFMTAVSAGDGRPAVDELLDEAATFDLVTVHPETGARRLTLQPLGSVGLTMRYPAPRGCEWLYRYLSGYSHGRLWALSVAADTANAQHIGNDMFTVLAATPDRHLAGAVGQVVNAVALALGRLSALKSD